MASPVVDWMSDVTSLWEALTPPTRTTVTYSEVTSKSVGSGTASHRKFFWHPPIRKASTLETSSSSLIEWEISAEIRLSINGLSHVEFADAIANESNLLVRAVEKNSSWSAGVTEAIGEDVKPEIDPESEDCVLVLTWRVTTYETD